SWYVKTRSKPFQLYFESGFPYEGDQWISISATSWATAALSLTVPNPNKDADPKKEPEKGKRRAPSILTPDEGAVAVAFTQVSSHILVKQRNRELIMVLGTPPNTPGGEREARYVPVEELAKNKN